MSNQQLASNKPEFRTPALASPIEQQTAVPTSGARFERPQFGLRGMFIAVTLLAVYFGLARWIEVWALVIAFAAYIVLRLQMFQEPEKKTTGVQLVLDLLAGVLLPLGCLIHDPFFFHEPTARVIGFTTIGSQIMVLTAWMFLAPLAGRWAFGFVAGFLMFGAAIAFCIGLVMSPLSFFAMLILIGALGLIPFFTAGTYFRHSRKAFRYALSGNEGRALWALGFLVALAIPFMAARLAPFVPREWLKPPQQNWLGFPMARHD